MLTLKIYCSNNLLWTSYRGSIITWVFGAARSLLTFIRFYIPQKAKQVLSRLCPPCACGWLTLTVAFLGFFYVSHLSQIPFTHFCSIELVLCPFRCSLSALWFPAVSSRHQLTFSSVFRMTTNSGSRQPVSASSSKSLQAPNLQTHALYFIKTLLHSLRSLFKHLLGKLKFHFNV